MWELFTSQRVFEDSLSIGQVFYMIAYQGWRPSPPPGCPSEYAALMMACWHAEAEQRPTIHEVIRTLQRLYVAEKQAIAATHSGVAVLVGRGAVTAVGPSRESDDAVGALAGVQTAVPARPAAVPAAIPAVQAAVPARPVASGQHTSSGQAGAVVVTHSRAATTAMVPPRPGGASSSGTATTTSKAHDTLNWLPVIAGSSGSGPRGRRSPTAGGGRAPHTDSLAWAQQPALPPGPPGLEQQQQQQQLHAAGGSLAASNIPVAGTAWAEAGTSASYSVGRGSSSAGGDDYTPWAAAVMHQASGPVAAQLRRELAVTGASDINIGPGRGGQRSSRGGGGGAGGRGGGGTSGSGSGSQSCESEVMANSGARLDTAPTNTLFPNSSSSGGQGRMGAGCSSSACAAIAPHQACPLYTTEDADK